MAITLSKLLPSESRPAQVLLAKARKLPLSYAQRQTLPAHIDADGEHLHHALAGHRPIEVGDVLLDQDAKFWLVEGAPEPLLRVTGSIEPLMMVVYALGSRQSRIAMHEHGFDVLPDDKLKMACEMMGLSAAMVVAPFQPLPQAAAHHDHHDGHVHGPGCNHDH